MSSKFAVVRGGTVLLLVTQPKLVISKESNQESAGLGMDCVANRKGPACGDAAP